MMPRKISQRQGWRRAHAPPAKAPEIDAHGVKVHAGRVILVSVRLRPKAPLIPPDEPFDVGPPAVVSRPERAYCALHWSPS
jgi:hypothetical protein